MYSNNNNNSNNKNKKKIKKKERQWSGEREGVKRKIYIFFPSLVSLKDLRKLVRRILSEQEAKFIHASRATCENQNLGVSLNSTR